MKRKGIVTFATAASILALLACVQEPPKKRTDLDDKRPVVADEQRKETVKKDAKAATIIALKELKAKSEEVRTGAQYNNGSRDRLLALQPAQRSSMGAAQTGGMKWQRPVLRPDPTDRERYAVIEDNQVRAVLDHPVSTFSVDVDTASYANVRRLLNEGRLPPKHAVRIEEMINYFNYAYEAPTDRAQPFSAHYDVARTPWNKNSMLLRIGLKGMELDQGERKPANLVFLLDVSGSMNSATKLPLLKSALKMLLQSLDDKDRVSIVVYAGASGVVLEPTSGDEKGVIHAALDRLRAGGSTAGGAGINLAYAMAEKAFIKDGINRVILGTDGDFNVGVRDVNKLKEIIAKKRESGISLTTLGFGRGNINDHLMETLADTGNGNYAYIDTAREARKVLGEQITGTLQTIAKDVKIQVEFNPAKVAEYRLIGYVNRKLKREDFNNDKVDAGEIGAGHKVTALYEIIPVGSPGARLGKLRYGNKEIGVAQKNSNEFAHIRLRYKMPGGSKSKLIETPLYSAALKNVPAAEGDLAFAAAVAAFGQKLRGGKYLEDFSYADIQGLAMDGLGPVIRRGGSVYRSEFVDLVKLAAALDQRFAKKSK